MGYFIRRLAEGLTLPENTKGISKFEAFLKNQNFSEVALVITFLRNLQLLRSTGVAHRKGANYTKAAKIFDLENREYKDVAADLFTAVLQMLNALGKKFLSEVDWDDRESPQ